MTKKAPAKKKKTSAKKKTAKKTSAKKTSAKKTSTKKKTSANEPTFLSAAAMLAELESTPVFGPYMDALREAIVPAVALVPCEPQEGVVPEAKAWATPDLAKPSDAPDDARLVLQVRLEALQREHPTDLLPKEGTVYAFMTDDSGSILMHRSGDPVPAEPNDELDEDDDYGDIEGSGGTYRLVAAASIDDRKWPKMEPRAAASFRRFSAAAVRTNHLFGVNRMAELTEEDPESYFVFFTFDDRDVMMIGEMKRKKLGKNKTFKTGPYKRGDFVVGVC